MADEIGYGTRVQFLTYWDKATVNVGASRSVSPARVANSTLSGEIHTSGRITLNGLKANALVTLSINTAYAIYDVLKRLESDTQEALNDGTTLGGDTNPPDYYLWENTLVTSGTSKISPTEYEYGDRTDSITVTASYGLLASGQPSNAVDGVYGYDIIGGWSTDAIDNTDHWIKFDFGEGNKRIVDEVTWQSLGSETHGTWKWQGSNDDRTYIDLGDSFTLGGEGTQVQDSIADNATGYRYYRLAGAGGTTGTQLQQEVFFKVIDAPAEAASVTANLSAAQLNFIDEEIQRGISAIDNLVAAAEMYGTNILSSQSRAIDIQFTQFGGRLTVYPQPLDANGLDISGVRALSNDDAEQALNAIQNAISSTRARLDELHKVQNGMNFAKGALSGSVTSGQSVLPTGTLVDVLA